MLLRPDRGVLLAVLLLVTSLSACRRTPSVVIPDAGPEPDAPIPFPATDSDDDGLCDTTEAALGTDWNDPDTDGDGYSDAIEYATGYDPRRAITPDPASVVFLEESEGARAETAVRFVASGEGQSFVGSFRNFGGIFADPDHTALTYLAAARAVGALPSEAILSVEGERFIGLRDRATLVSSLTFENATEPSGCVRGFAYQYFLVDDTNGRIASTYYGLLVVTPPGLEVRGDTWCRFGAPTECF